MKKIAVDEPDLEKIRDALLDAGVFFQQRDEMNATVHLAKTTRMSPLTSKLLAASERISTIISLGEVVTDE